MSYLGGPVQKSSSLKTPEFYDNILLNLPVYIFSYLKTFKLWKFPHIVDWTNNEMTRMFRRPGD